MTYAEVLEDIVKAVNAGGVAGTAFESPLEGVVEKAVRTLKRGEGFPLLTLLYIFIQLFQTIKLQV